MTYIHIQPVSRLLCSRKRYQRCGREGQQSRPTATAGGSYAAAAAVRARLDEGVLLERAASHGPIHTAVEKLVSEV